jgi:hypothetical protein
MCGLFYMTSRSTDLIELSDSENELDFEPIDFNNVNLNHDTQTFDIVLIEKDTLESDEPKVKDFVKFCIKKGLFDNTFYDYGNAFSVVATKLPVTFEKLSSDGENIPKKAFVTGFTKSFRYKGDIEFIYKYIDKDNKGFITWEEFTQFYLPFVRYTTL